MTSLTFGAVVLWITSIPRGLAQNVGYNLGPLQQLAQFRRHHRRTTDGRLCAAAFVQDDQAYTDCTTAKAPDGTQGVEWCYVEVQLFGKGGVTSDWGFCLPPVDYERVRRKAREAFDMKAAEAEKMRLVYCQIEQIELLNKTVLQAETCHKKAEQVSASAGKLKRQLRVLRQAVDAERRHALTTAENCALLAGIVNRTRLFHYEEEAFPDGVRGLYYGNALFTGPPRLTRTDRTIDFLFAGEGPAEGLDSHEYSIRWEGYVKAPRSGLFTFIVETDSGVRLFFNEQPIIVDGMPAATNADAVGHNSVPLTAVPPSSGPRKIKSQPVELFGGDKYKIRVEFVHTSHFKYENQDVSFIKLLWKSASTREEIIPRQYFFTSNMSPPLKISSLDPRHFEVSLLLDGEKAFADTDSFTIGDVPQQFKGLRLIRSRAEPNLDSFSFSVNLPAVAYVAFPVDHPFPLAADADEQHKSRSGAARTAREVAGVSLSLHHHYGPAATSTSLQLRNFVISEKTGGTLTLTVVEKGVPFLIFLKKLQSADTSCGGVEEILSLASGPEFADCEASSQQGERFGCRAALSGKHIDEKDGVWRTATGNEMDEDQSETFGILHTDNMDNHSYSLERPVITSYVKAAITEMYVNGEDSGGSFEFWGTPCSPPENDEDDALPSVEVIEVELSRCMRCLKTCIDVYTACQNENNIWVGNDPISTVRHFKSLSGWLRPAHPVNCSSSDFPNLLNQGGISFFDEAAVCVNKTGLSEEEESCRENFWSISVPENGSYQLTVQLGNPCEPETGTRTYFLQANGVPVVEALNLEKAQFFVAVHQVEVTDKIILLSAICDVTGNIETLCKDAVTTIMNVVVERL